MKKKQTKEKTINRVLLGLIVFLLAVIVISSIFYLRSSRPAVQAKKEAVEIAKKYAKCDCAVQRLQGTAGAARNHAGQCFLR